MRNSFFTTFVIGITNPAAILTFLFAFSYFGISEVGGWSDSIYLVAGVFLGTYFWWGTLSTLTQLIKRRAAKFKLRTMNRILVESFVPLESSFLLGYFFDKIEKVVKCMNRKLSFIFSCVLVFAVLLTGCGSGNTQTAEDSSSEPTVSSQMDSGETIMTSQPESSDTESSDPSSERNEGKPTSEEEEITTMKMNVQIGGSTFTATLDENEAVDALVDMMEQGPVTIRMSDYSGFEKVGPLGTSLPASNQQTTTQAGDIVLYQGNQIVMFYGSNSWSYTRLGHIDDLTGWEEALGSGDVTVTFSLEE